MGRKKVKTSIFPNLLVKHDPEKTLTWWGGVFPFQCFVFFLIFAFSCLSFSSFPLLLVECPQMWVWPQVPLEGPPPPLPPLHPRTPPPHQTGLPCPGALQKEARGWGEERGRGRGGKGFGLREGPSNCNGGGGTLETPVKARPTSGSSLCFLAF